MPGIQSSTGRAEEPVFSLVIGVDNLDESEWEIAVDLDKDARGRVGRHLDLLAVEDWRATAWLRQTEDGLGVVLRVTFSAYVIQSCVVTLEPVRSHVQHSFTTLYLPERQIGAAEMKEDAELVVNVEGDDFPEPLPDGGIDVGEAIVEQFALALDPYPRDPAAMLSYNGGGERAADEDRRESENPFAALKSWQTRK